MLRYLEPCRGIAKYLKKLNVFLKEDLGEQPNLTMMVHSQHRSYQKASQWNLFANLTVSQAAAE